MAGWPENKKRLFVQEGKNNRSFIKHSMTSMSL